MRQHTGEKPVQCKQCKFKTRDPSVMHKHQQRHGEKVIITTTNFVTSICSTKFYLNRNVYLFRFINLNATLVIIPVYKVQVLKDIYNNIIHWNIISIAVINATLLQ